MLVLRDINNVRHVLVAIGCLLVVVSPFIGAIPGPGGIIVFAAGITLVLRFSRKAKKTYVRLKQRWPKHVAWVDWALRRKSDMEPNNALSRKIAPSSYRDFATLDSGLSSDEARRRLKMRGANELPREKRRTKLRVIGEVLREPMLALLLAGGLGYLLLGDLTEAMILLAFATFSVVVTVVQESRTENVLEALRDLSAPRAMVVRDAERQRIAGREVVEGDVIVLEQGDRVAADVLLLNAHDIQVDESLLTGESVAVRKTERSSDTWPLNVRPGGEDQPCVYAGSLIVRGSGVGHVVATGPRSAIGQIGQSLFDLETEAPRLKTEVARIVMFSALGGGIVSLLVVGLYGFLHGGWIEAVLAGIAVGMAMLPEEFPVVLTVFLAMGAWRIGRAGVLTRKAASIETLGSATILCTDKTGTLTENIMRVAELWLPSGACLSLDRIQPVSESFHHVIDIAALASAPQPSDPMEVAIHAARDASQDQKGDLKTLVHSYGLRPHLLAMSNVWQTGENHHDLLIATKGAPEAVISLCKLSSEIAVVVNRAANDMAARGIRVLGVACGRTQATDWAPSQECYSYELVGLIGLADPIREGVAAAVNECHTAGVRVVMITGDLAATARAIASQAGIANGDVITGSELALLDDPQLAERLKTVSVFARIMPEQKLRIVQAFKADGEVVAMTGDGVNDSPSLKAAHIGIAMGKRGTDVAREASAIVLLDDDFGSIVKAIELGRRIYDNIRKAMAFIFAIHVPIAGLALLPLFLGLPILFGPIHIALIEMVIDPVCALVFEAEGDEKDIMRRQPRGPTEKLFSNRMIIWGVFQGAAAFALLATTFLIATHAALRENQIRAGVFFALIAEILALVLVNRSFTTAISEALLRKNIALRYVLLAVGAISALILGLPAAQHLLKFDGMSWPLIGLALLHGVVLLIILELCKPLANRMIETNMTNQTRKATMISAT